MYHRKENEKGKPLPNAIKVLIADKHPLICESLFALLKTYPQVSVVGKAMGGREIIELVKELEPDLVVMDIFIPVMDISEIIREIRKHDGEVKVLLVSDYEDRECILRGLKAGGNGYLPKCANAAELVNAIRVIHDDGYFLYPSVAKKLVEEYLNMGKNPTLDPLDRLSYREVAVLRLIAEGNKNRQIAEILRIAPKTVEAHRTNLMSKLGIHSYTELVRYAFQKRLIETRH